MKELKLWESFTCFVDSKKERDTEYNSFNVRRSVDHTSNSVKLETAFNDKDKIK